MRLTTDPAARRTATVLLVIAIVLSVGVGVFAIAAIAAEPGDVRAWLGLAALALITAASVYVLRAIARSR